MISVFASRIKQVADGEFTNSAELGWLILHAGESGWPLLSIERLHRQNPPLVSASSSSAMLCGRWHLSHAEEF